MIESFNHLTFWYLLIIMKPYGIKNLIFCLNIFLLALFFTLMPMESLNYFLEIFFSLFNIGCFVNAFELNFDGLFAKLPSLLIHKHLL